MCPCNKMIPVLLVSLAAIMGSSCVWARGPAASVDQEIIDLPNPAMKGETSLEEVLDTRRSIREYADRPLSHAEIGQLLWAAQGITSEHGFRTAPSAGALYPLETYVAIESGVYRYDPANHRLIKTFTGEWRKPLGDAALRQGAVYDAPAVFLFAAVYQRTAARYGDRAERYVWIEVGHAAQNLLLQAAAMDLGAVPIGAFYDDQVKSLLQLPEDEEPLYLIPVGAQPAR